MYIFFPKSPVLLLNHGEILLIRHVDGRLSRELDRSSDALRGVLVPGSRHCRLEDGAVSFVLSIPCELLKRSSRTDKFRIHVRTLCAE